MVNEAMNGDNTIVPAAPCSGAAFEHRGSRLVITDMEYKGRIRRFHLLEEDRKIAGIRIENFPDGAGKKPVSGNIYMGIVESISRNLDAAFVKISPEDRCYLPLKEAECPVYALGKKKEGLPQEGDLLLLQVTREQIKSKLPSVTAGLTLPGQYMVFSTKGTGISYSRKLSSEEKKRLSGIFEPLFMEDALFSIVVRTNAGGISAAEIQKEYRSLKEVFSGIIREGRSRALYTCLYRKDALFIEMLRDIPRNQLREVLTDNEDVFYALKEWTDAFAPELNPRIRFYEDALMPLPKLLRLEKCLEEALSGKVWLKCGGFLVIEQTEAFVTIDVNSGKYTGRKKPEEAFREVNLMAAQEIARQLRLRNLSGVILIDFINMKNPDHEEELLHVLRKHLKKDPVKCEAVDITPLHIAEVTRQKTGPSLMAQAFSRE